MAQKYRVLHNQGELGDEACLTLKDVSVLGQEEAQVELEVSELAAKERLEKGVRMKRHARGENAGTLGKYDDFDEIEKNRINSNAFEIEENGFLINDRHSQSQSIHLTDTGEEQIKYQSVYEDQPKRQKRSLPPSTLKDIVQRAAPGNLFFSEPQFEPEPAKPAVFIVRKKNTKKTQNSSEADEIIPEIIKPMETEGAQKKFIVPDQFAASYSDQLILSEGRKQQDDTWLQNILDDKSSELVPVENNRTELEEPSREFELFQIQDEINSFERLEKPVDLEISTLREPALDEGAASFLALIRARGLLGQGGRTEESDDDIKIEYKDKFGRVLAPKEAYKQLSWGFHGTKPGRNKQLKMKSKFQQERKVIKSSAGSHQTLSSTLQSLTAKQQQPFIVLSEKTGLSNK